MSSRRARLSVAVVPSLAQVADDHRTSALIGVSPGAGSSSANSAAVASGTNSAGCLDVWCRNQATAATAGVRTMSVPAGIPIPASLSTIACRGREVVLVRKRYGTPSRVSQSMVPAAPGTGCSPT